MFLLNPKKYVRNYPDEKSQQIMLKTIAFFENKGKANIKKDDHDRVWYADFLEFIKEENIFATLLTPEKYGTDQDARWDTWRNCGFNEILGFYGLAYWYTWQVSILGLGPIWMGENEALKEKAAQLLQDGAIFAFGLSERQHGADIYSTDMRLSPQGDGTYRANGSKYYIGNANAAPMVSTFGKLDDTDEYVFFTADFQHENYELIQNVTNSQNYVAEYALKDYPITEDEILAKGQAAWDSALNTVNVGKYNLGWASIGMCTHALYEAINHAANRRLYNMHVTDFPHVKQMFTDAYARLVAMKLFVLRAADYMRAASREDRRYLLYNPMVKMKVTTQGEEVINLLWDVIAAKGFEKDMFFAMAARDIRALPKLEGTVHVNIALIVKFMPNYFFVPGEYPDLLKQDAPRNDDFLFDQGPTRGLGKILFHDYKIAFENYDLPNINLFAEQVAVFKEFLAMATPDDAQRKDIDFLMALGELFALVVYGQLILENAKIYNMDEILVDQIFDFMVRDFSKFALQLYSKPSSTATQMEFCQRMIRKPIVDEARYKKIWEEHVFALKDTYEMNP
ncbi:MAG: acyl-CoA dehydrogenase [Anaerolineae bacterium]|jgi:acyl-CoA dehydrogenase|nr:acyl-CoA dehydrogenase [Anaerolineae bacterium]MBT7072295.1 acyl-CoA dehydrogenase [Anaerolineae bacterium]MBT7326112.1 acyl-CoA dehydrogenase [Anaerolineae bacterium]MBT7601777.1 acyl-CoA dehydrogenase [Anaerolineae bacterium]